MINVITAIALLCQTPSGTGGGWNRVQYVKEGLDIVSKHQLICQQNYIKCIKNKTKLAETRLIPLEDLLTSCILEK